MIRNAIVSLWSNFWFRVALLVALCGAAPFYMLSIAQAFLID